MIQIANELQNPKDINTVFKTAGISEDTAKTVLEKSKWSSKLNDLVKPAEASADATTNLGIALNGLKSIEDTGDKLSSGFTGLLSTIPPIVPAALALGGALTILYGLTKYANQFNDAVAKASESQSSYNGTASELNNLNSQLSTSAQRISELQALKNVGAISVTEQRELETLKLQNQELERQRDLKQQEADEQSEATVNDALAALKLKRTKDLTQQYTGITEIGEEYTAGYKETDIVSATKNEIDELTNLQAKRSDLLDKLNNTTSKSKKESYSKDLNDLDWEIAKYSKTISENVGTLNTLRESFKDPITGLMKDGLDAEAQSYYRSMTDLIDASNALNLSGNNSALSRLTSYFDSSPNRNFIKDALMEALKAGENLEDTLKGMGLSLENLGINNIDELKHYLDNAKSSAETASQAVDALDGSLESVQTAFNTSNQGNNWSSIAGYLNQANDLYKQGLIGTDDFQSAAQLILPDKIDIAEGENKAEAYANAWEKAYEKVSRWFNAENPDESIMNFVHDLDAVDGIIGNADDALIGMDETGGRFNLDFKFKSTAEAAKQMGTSIEVVEALLHKFEEYGYEFDDIFFSGEKIEAYKRSLDDIHTLFNSLNEGTGKERLERLMGQWDSDYEHFLENPDELSDEQIIQLRFEYDMASLQSEINRLQELWNEGDHSAETGAALNASKRAYRDKREEDTGFDESDDEGYRAASDKITELQSLFTAEQDTAKREDTQNQISAILDLQNAFQDAFSDGEVVDWESFLNSEQAQAVMQDIMNTTNLSKDTLEELLNIDLDELFSEEPVIKLTTEADVANIESLASDLEIGETLTFTADIGGVEQEIEAIKNEDGTISYYTKLDDTLTQVQLNKDGTVTYVVNEVPGTKVTPPDGPYERTVNEVQGQTVETIPNATAVANFGLGSYPTSIPPIFQTVYQVPVNLSPGVSSVATGTLLSPAHADGGVSLPQNETALVNELGTESIIRNGKWMLIPGGMHREHLKKGDIILNAGQTKSLMKYGKAAGRGRAYADGTLNSVVSNAYANGSGDTPEPETFDWIENRIKHLESLTENWKTKLESVTTFKAQNSYIGQIISAIQNEISNLNESYNAYMAKAASIGLSSDYVEKIQNGQLNIEDITDENLQEKIKEYQDWYDKAEDCRTSMEDLKIDVKDLNEERIDNITDDFDNLSSLFKTIISHHETLNELSEKQGKSLGQSDYDSLIKYNNELKAAKSEELKNMQSEFQRLMEEQENFVGSDLYLRMQENMFSLKDDIASIDIELENIKGTIVESDFSSFKKNETHLKNFADELDRVGDLLNENDFFTDKGQFTSTGLTKIALISEQMSTARQLAAEYENAIDQLGKHLAKGNITQEEYNESLEEYRKNAQNAAADVKQYKEAILDLVKEGLNQELNANKELISARKEALKGLKDYDNYQKKIEDKNKDIQSLQAQLAALEGQSGQNVERQRRELQAKLKELETDKQELIDDRAYDLRMDSYDKARDELQEKYDAYIKDLESNSQAQEKVISDTLKNVQNNYGSIANELNKIGVNMSEDVAKPWLSAKNAANQYMNTMKEAEAKSKITSQKIDTSKREDASVIQSIAPKPSEKGAEKPQAPAPQQPSKPSGPKSPNDLGLDPSPSTKGLSWLNKEVSIRDRLLYNGWASSDRNYQLLHEWAGGQGSWTGTAEQNIHILNALKAAGFSQGGILQATGEDGIFLGRNKEAVLTETQWNTIRNLADTAPVLTHPLPHFSAPQNSDTVTNIFDAPLIQVEGKADEYTVRELRRLAKSIAPMIGKEFYKDARKIGLK